MSGGFEKENKSAPPRSLFRKRGNRKAFYDFSSAKENVNNEEQANVTEAVREEETHEFARELLGEDHSMEYLLGTMKNSKTRRHRGISGFLGKKNSQQYTNVMDAMSLVVEISKTPFKANRDENLNCAGNLSNAYARLIGACQEYLDKPGGETGSGLARKNTVRCVKALAEKDRVAVQECYYEIYARKISEEDQGKLRWEQVIRKGREATIEVDDLHDDNVFRALGGNLKKGDEASRLMKAGVFTKEKKIDISVSGNLAAGLNDSKRGGDTKDYGTETSLTNRNVATSRMAGLLGLSHIVEESKIVNVKDKKSGLTYRGNLMSVAKGTAGAAEEDAMSEAVMNMQKLEDRRKAVLSKIAPSVQEELTSLQVLDYICGQNDRHANNFFLEKDAKSQYSHVHGIDNDQSFSTGVNLKDDVVGSEVFVSTKARAVVGDKGELVIPYMDRQLAVNIINLQSDTVRFILQDLLEPKYIDKTIQRLELVKNALQKENLESERFRKTGDWDNQTAETMLDKTFMMKIYHMAQESGEGWNKTVPKANWDTNKESTYFGEFVARAMGFTANAYMKNGKWNGMKEVE